MTDMSGPEDPTTPEVTTEEAPAATPEPATNNNVAAVKRDGFRGLPRLARWAAYFAAGLVLALIAALITVVVLVRRPLPQTSGTIQIAGLTGRVEVLRDDFGIPQIYADSLGDLMLAQGYVHAQERFYQMDYRRHLTAGRLSELYGSVALSADKAIRTLGWRRVAERELAIVTPETRAALQAYADGVNAYLADRKPSEIALSYSLLRVSGLSYTPEPWTPVDSLAWLKAMAWDLQGNMSDEIARVQLGVNHTEEQVVQLYPDYPYDEHRTIVGEGGVVRGVFDQNLPATQAEVAAASLPPSQRRVVRQAGANLAAIPELIGRGSEVGSNSWVVDGEHSATGAPLLANDPHLGISLPGVWMQVGLHCRTVTPECPLDVAGFSFAGVPGVIIGHNANIAWGFTNLGPDVADLFLERIEGTQWRQDGKLHPLTVRHETIVVRGGKDFDLTVRETAHGPLLSDVDAELSTVGANAEIQGNVDRGNGFAVSLAWTASTPSNTADAILQLNQAADWTQFRAAAKNFAVPAQNLIYADRDGHIGYQTPGQVPIRGPGNDGWLPSEGWRSENDWTGEFVPFAALPTMLDPDEGFIVTANQAVVGPEYPYFLGNDWDQGYRSERIRDLLTDEGELSMAEMSELQLDDLNPMADTLVPYLLDVEDLGSAYFRDGQELLVDWDRRQPADSAAAAYYNVVWSNVLRLTFHDELRESLWPDGGGRWFSVMSKLLAAPADPWWDDQATEDVIETRDDILRVAMRDARDELTRRIALDPGAWTWGRLHQLDLREGTLGESGVGPIEWMLNRGDYEVGGGGSLVNATGWRAGEGYHVATSPSMRMVISLADFDDSRWINLTGVSGHPFGGHYVDQTELWVAGETLPWAFGADAIEKATEDTLILEPDPGS